MFSAMKDSMTNIAPSSSTFAVRISLSVVTDGDKVNNLGGNYFHGKVKGSSLTRGTIMS